MKGTFYEDCSPLDIAPTLAAILQLAPPKQRRGSRPDSRDQITGVISSFFCDAELVEPVLHRAERKAEQSRSTRNVPACLFHSLQ